MAHDVFISYSAQDKGTADAACAFLEKEGVRCWIAPRDAVPGAPWAASIMDAIASSRVMLLVFSSRSNDSEHVLREVAAAADAGVAILPFRVEDTQPSKELAYYIRRAHWLDAVSPPIASHLSELRDTLRRLLERAPAVEAPVPEPAPRRGTLARVLGSRRGRVAALGTLLVVVLGGAAVAWSRRSGTLAIESEPADAVATVDGAAAGRTPLALPVASGTHGVLVRRAGFKEWSKVVEVGPGEKASFSLQLKVADSKDADAVNLLAKPLGIALPRFALPEAQRQPPEGDPVELVEPRGNIRPDDLAVLTMDVDPERVEISGSVEIRRGEVSLWKAPFEPKASAYRIDVPPAVRAGLRAGETLTWGWWPARGAAATAKVRVATDDRRATLAEIDRRLAEQPDVVRRHLRAQHLFDHSLFTGAYLETRAIADADPGDVRAGALMEQSLVRMGAGDLRVAAALRDALRNAPRGERERVFGAPPDGDHR